MRGCQHNDEALVSTHNIRDYMLLIRGEQKTAEKVDIMKEKLAGVAFLRKLMKKPWAYLFQVLVLIIWCLDYWKCKLNDLQLNQIS